MCYLVGLISRKKVELEDFESKKGMICVRPMDVCTRNLRQKAEKGKITGTESATRFLQALCLKKSMRSVPEIWGHTYDVLPWSAKGMRKLDKKFDSHAAKKGAKK
jgi:hypothetical protein